MACKTYLCLFAQQHPEFRLPELLSLASLTKSEIKYESYSKTNPLFLVQFASEENARQVTRRSLLIRSVFELWGSGRNQDELETSVKLLPPEIMDPYKKTNYTFKVVVRGFSRKCSAERQLKLYERLSYLPLAGKVNLTNPDHEFHLLEDYGDNPNEAPVEPHRVFLGRLISHGQRHLIQKYAVKNRYFIGNTSMDAQLSLIMANVAQVKEGSWVFDPFVGTGSLLVAAAHYGGFVTGADIDYLLLHGKGRASRAGAESKWRSKDENVFSNLRQYGLGDCYLDVLVADAAKCVWRQGELFDAIITDPPYGIREGRRKLGSKNVTPNPIPPEFVESYIPAVCSYHLSDLFADLLDFAAKFLVLGGRLVYWLPIIRNEFTVSLIPIHPCLEMTWCCEQPLQRQVGRRLIVMEKKQQWMTELHGQAITSREHDHFRKKYFTNSLPHTAS